MTLSRIVWNSLSSRIKIQMIISQREWLEESHRLNLTIILNMICTGRPRPLCGAAHNLAKNWN